MCSNKDDTKNEKEFYKTLKTSHTKRIAATSSGDLTANDVIANLFDLFEQLGLRNSQAATSLTDTAAFKSLSILFMNLRLQ